MTVQYVLGALLVLVWLARAGWYAAPLDLEDSNVVPRDPCGMFQRSELCWLVAGVLCLGITFLNDNADSIFHRSTKAGVNEHLIPNFELHTESPYKIDKILARRKVSR